METSVFLSPFAVLLQAHFYKKDIGIFPSIRNRLSSVIQKFSQWSSSLPCVLLVQEISSIMGRVKECSHPSLKTPASPRTYYYFCCSSFAERKIETQWGSVTQTQHIHVKLNYYFDYDY